MPGVALKSASREFIRETLKISKSGAGSRIVHRAETHLRSITRLNYSCALKNHFDRRQLLELVSELRSLLPGLNRKLFCETNLGRLASIAARFGAVLEARPFDEPEGRTLRGFYANDRSLLKLPLICLNTASHPIGVAAAFWHEIGHHLTHEIFGSHPGQFNLTFASNYESHLDSPEELIADAVMVLAAYPHETAQRLFGDTQGARTNCHPDLLVRKVLGHLRSVAGFRFPTELRRNEQLHILAGMVHAARLRVTLLQEYGI